MTTCRVALRNAIVWLAAALVLSAAAVAGDVLPVDFRLEQILTGTARPSGIAIAPDGRIFYGERTTGSVRIVVGGVLKTTPFVTLSVASAGAGEGLLDVALHPAFADNHWVYVFYTESGTRANRIRRYTEVNGIGQAPLDILNLGSSPTGTRIGGSMEFGADGKLYVTTGDFETSGNAQNTSSLAGKLLRLNSDGTIPSDNPIAGNRMYAKGFRNGGGLGVNRSVGTLYQTDQGVSGVKEECNAVPEGNGATVKNYAWDLGSGKLNNPAVYVDPLTEHSTIVTPAAVASYTAAKYGASYPNDIFYACSTNGKIEEVDVTGVKLDTFSSTKTFYDPTTDGDGTADASCPKKWVDSAISGDGYLYMTADPNSSANGIYRVLYDDSKGPREISAPGTTHPVLLRKTDATHVQMTWEDQKRDAFVGAPLASGQHNSLYTIWKGLLPIDSNGNGTPDWSHSSLATTNGTVVNDGTLSYDFVIGGGSSEYYLISSQNANKEGPLGYGSNLAQIPGVGEQDWCNVVGFGRNVNQCAHPEFKSPTGAVIQLPDENGVMHSLSEYRTGRVVHLDIGAFNCGPCQLQATEEDDVENRYRGRGAKSVMIMLKDLNTASPPANQTECTNEINTWRSNFGGDYTILCDRDTNGNGRGDVFEQFDSCSCFPSNHYIDRNWVIYQYDAGFSVGLENARIGPKAWPEWCE